MKAVYFRHNCVLVKDQCTIEVLQKSGLGARVLNPIITSAECVEAEGTSPLLLLDEEALYLSQKGVLEIEIVESQEMATPEFLWSSFVTRNANFPIKYKVFSYFKDKGYVVRTGINFGVDYCIYHTLPSLCHSEMCVTVIDATKDSANPSNVSAEAGSAESVSVVKEDLNQLNWRHVTTLTRVIPDVNKLCILCYVLPSCDVTNMPTSKVAPICGQADAPPSCISPLDILADAVDDICVTESTAAPAATVISEDSNNSVRMSTSVPGPEPSAPTVSPYLSSLFPSYTLPNTTNTETATSIPSIDFSTPACLECLSVHPVTALVRRMPALAETYQTIKKVQETYHSASTAQKKRDIKAANQKEKFNKNNNKGNKGNNKSYQKNKQAPPLADTVNTENNNTPITATTNTSNHSLFNAEQQDYLFSADPATLSGRQKRVAKYLQKAQTQQKAAVLLPQSKQMKERRDHRENRSKTMSNKNQSLLDLMHGGEKKYTTASSESNIDSISGEADSAVNSAGAIAYPTVENDTEMQTNGGIVDSANDGISTGTKRKFADKSDTNDEGSFWSIAQLFNPFAPASSTVVLGPNRDTVTLSTTDATDTGDSTSGAVDSTDETSTERRKRCRTKYGREEDTATNGETNSRYLDRAVKHCIIL